MLRALFLTLAGILIVLALLCLCSCGTTRAQRFHLYETGATVLGHPEVAAGIGLIGQLIPDKQPRKEIQP